MSKNVCMFVWNHFTNDARVLRECTALSEAGYSIDLICIHDPGHEDLPRIERRDSNFNVYRVRRYPVLLQLLQGFYKKSLQNKFLGIIVFLLWLATIYFSPIVVSTITVLVFVFLKTKLKTVWVRGSIFVRMILKGYRKKYDAYHSNDLNTLPQGYVCSKFRFNKKKLIYDSHEVQTSRTGYDNRFYGKLEQFLITKIDAMIVENHTRAKYNEGLYGFYPNVVYNYPFKQKSEKQNKFPLREKLNIAPNEEILLYQGGIQAGRGLDKLIQAVPLFKSGVLVLIGDGRIKPDLEKMVEEMNLHEKVKFLPKVAVEELPEYTRNGYIGFQVLNNTNYNHYSASSNKLFEYIMSGVPVVACSFPEIKKVVEEENIGICVDSHNPESIAEGVNYLLENQDVRERMVSNCYIAKDKYNWDKEKKNFLAVYESI